MEKFYKINKNGRLVYYTANQLVYDYLISNENITGESPKHFIESAANLYLDLSIEDAVLKSIDENTKMLSYCNTMNKTNLDLDYNIIERNLKALTKKLEISPELAEKYGINLEKK